MVSKELITQVEIFVLLQIAVCLLPSGSYCIFLSQQYSTTELPATIQETSEQEMQAPLPRVSGH